MICLGCVYRSCAVLQNLQFVGKPCLYERQPHSVPPYNILVEMLESLVALHASAWPSARLNLN
jgi:hypothetical protein